MNSRLVILDANVIIEAFKHKFWNSLVSQFNISVSSIVLHNEVYFYLDENNQKVDIDLATEVSSGRITEISATADEIASLINKVNVNFVDRIDDGEQESIALLNTGRFDDYRYCTGDTRAIKALSSLGMGALGISLEELLGNINQEKKLPDPSYSKKVFNRKKQEGLDEQHMFLKKK